MPIPERREPGRPPANAADRERLRRKLLQGTAQAYARLGYHAVTVEDILRSAQVSRPTFYRVFRDKHAAIAAVVRAANADLLLRMQQAVTAPGGSPMERALDAYFEWGLQNGAVAQRIYLETGLRESPASTERERTLDLIQQGMQMPAVQRTRSADTLLYQALLRAVEHLGSLAFASADETYQLRCRSSAKTLLRSAE